MNAPMHRSFLVVDVENSSELGNVELAAMRATLYSVLDDALTGSVAVVAKEDRGDGFLLILEASVLDVLDRLVGQLLEGVHQHNGTVGPLDWLRIRIAAHEGYVHQGPNGWSSDALTATFRMNNSTLVKETLKGASRAEAVVVVSDAVYQGIVRHNYRPTVTATGYCSADIPIQGDARVWIRVPGYAEPPVPVRTDAAPPAEQTGRKSMPGVDGVTANNMFVGDVHAQMIIGRDNVSRPA
ncbi:hypothetical protein [Nocardia sp. AG03]|uniref:hypothetical protein n=1 Tax=Nocardia sp. AG03 TaxID=3025312 RepID=UPI0024186721|nr:hypothetical protein [Nocardia sp. AG03]